MLVKYGMQIKDRLADVVSIGTPETLPAWNRRMKRRNWDYVLFFVHLKTRQIRIAGCTPHPDADWMRQQARNFCMTVNCCRQNPIPRA
jgi:hypothetical protein